MLDVATNSSMFRVISFHLFSPFFGFPIIVFLVRNQASLVFAYLFSHYLINTPVRLVLFLVSFLLVVFIFRICVFMLYAKLFL